VLSNRHLDGSSSCHVFSWFFTVYDVYELNGVPLVWDDGLYVQPKKVNAIFLLLLMAVLRWLDASYGFTTTTTSTSSFLPRSCAACDHKPFSLTRVIQPTDDHFMFDEEGTIWKDVYATLFCYVWAI